MIKTMNKLKCKICGVIDGEVSPNFPNNKFLVDPNELNDCNIKDIMKELNCCYECAFWEDKYRTINKDVVIINNEHWTIGEVDLSKDNRFIGMGGKRFYIKKINGDIITTNNIWFQGKIPKEFREKLPNNAMFISKEEYEWNLLEN